MMIPTWIFVGLMAADHDYAIAADVIVFTFDTLDLSSDADSLPDRLHCITDADSIASSIVVPGLTGGCDLLSDCDSLSYALSFNDDVIVPTSTCVVEGISLSYSGPL